MVGSNRLGLFAGRWLAVTCGGVGWLIASVALASDSSPDALAGGPEEETSARAPHAELQQIVVTARRRSEPLQQTPISVTAMSAQDLRDRSFESVADVARATPSLQFDVSAGDSGSSSAAFVRVRGIGPSDYNITADPAVGLYVDGVYYARPVGSVLDLLDIERIEVLRGPQGTLYGKNTPGGAINVTTAAPGDSFKGVAQVTTGSYRRADFDLALNGPIVANELSGKLAVASRNRDGYAVRADGGSLGGGNDLTARSQLRFTPGERFSLLLSVDGTQQRDESTAEELIKIAPNGGLLPFYNALVGGPFGQMFGSQFITGDPYRTDQTGFNKSNFDGYGMSAQAVLSEDSITVKSISAFRSAHALYGSDLDNSPLYYHENVTAERQRELSQELQFSGHAFGDRLDWVSGVYYFNEHGTDLLTVRLAQGLYQAVQALPGAVIPTGPGIICPAPSCLGGPSNPANVLLDVNLNDYLSLKTKSYAAYSQGIYHITAPLSVTVGVRYTYETKDVFAFTYHSQAGIYEVPPTARSASFHDVSPKFGMEFQFLADVMGYASVAEGFKSGGFNGRLNSVNSLVPYNPEKAWTYEIGAKSEFYDHRLRLNGAVYHTNYTDLQLTSNGTNGFQSYVITQNAGKARINGFELEADALPLPNLRVSIGVGLVDARYTELASTVTAAALGDRFSHTPRWTGNVAATYTFDAGAVGAFDLHSDWSYRSSFFNDTQNTPDIRQGGYGLVSARIVYRPRVVRDWLEVAASGTNLTNKVYWTGGLDTTITDGTAVVFPGRPREWGLAVTARF